MNMSRLERIERDIERLQKRIAEWQSRLKELDGQLTEAENTEIVAAIRAMKMTQKELRAFLKTGTLPSGLQDKAAITPARFEKKPEPKAVAADKPALNGKPNPATPATPQSTSVNKESEVKTNEA
jgi:cell division septum initiation protein DivIVA